MLCPYRSVGCLEMWGHGMPCPKFPIVHLAAYPATNRLSAARHGEETMFDDPVVRLSSHPWRIVSCKRVGSSISAKR